MSGQSKTYYIFATPHPPLPLFTPMNSHAHLAPGYRPTNSRSNSNRHCDGRARGAMGRRGQRQARGHTLRRHRHLRALRGREQRRAHHHRPRRPRPRQDHVRVSPPTERCVVSSWPAPGLEIDNPSFCVRICSFIGLINPTVTGIIGPGVVVHLPSFFDEFDALRGKGEPSSSLARSCPSHARSRARAQAPLTVQIHAGLDCTGRLFISDRAHLVFDFHQIVDGLKEVELGGSSCVFFFTILPPFNLARRRSLLVGGLTSIGTTKKGIGPAYSAKASRSGLRVHHLFDPAFAEKFRKVVEGRYKRYGHFEYDTEGEIERYKVRFSSACHPCARAGGVQFACSRTHRWFCLSKRHLMFFFFGLGIGGKASPFRH